MNMLNDASSAEWIFQPLNHCTITLFSHTLQQSRRICGSNVTVYSTHHGNLERNIRNLRKYSSDSAYFLMFCQQLTLDYLPAKFFEQLYHLMSKKEIKKNKCQKSDVCDFEKKSYHISLDNTKGCLHRTVAQHEAAKFATSVIIVSTSILTKKKF